MRTLLASICAALMLFAFPATAAQTATQLCTGYNGQPIKGIVTHVMEVGAMKIGNETWTG